ncbi:MAG: hypothetical protein M9920_00705 [Verrucomicrobiae bacterium]|nr:hypothetical protein [Verrucomicrobiae bacterium]
MTRHHDNRLSVRNYREALEGVETQFALIRFALSALSQNAIKGFFKTRLHNQIGAISQAFAKIKVGAQDDEMAKWNQTEEMLLEYTKKKHRKDSKPSDTRFKIELSEDRLNQSELLLFVAHFESFMKEVHRTFLTAAPAKVFSKRDTKFMLREAFQDGAGGCFSKFLNELIIKEVKFLDSQRVERRAEYFAEHFGVSFGAQKEVDDLREIMDTRNKISHEIYCPPPRSAEHVRDQPLVSDQMLKQARQLFRDIPQRCIEAGAKVYQSYFR